MGPDLLVGLVGYALVMSITPGPNNLMLLASGVNHGLRRSVPHMMGINVGIMVMLLLVGLGIGQFVLGNASIYTALKYASILYTCWLAWKIAGSGAVATRPVKDSEQSMSFVQALLFQWVNPKAWAMALTATAAFTTPENYASSLVVMAIVFGAVNAPCIGIWAAFGVSLRSLLLDPARMRVFNVLMALLLLASIATMVLEPGVGR